MERCGLSWLAHVMLSDLSTLSSYAKLEKVGASAVKL